MPWPNRKAVLVPIDFSDASFDALREALSLVGSPSDVQAIHVLQSLKTEPELVRAAFDGSARNAKAEAELRACVDQVQAGIQVIIRTGVAGDEIATAAEELGCDLIVIPSHGRSGLQRFFLGSVAERVLRSAKCPVLVLRCADSPE